MANPPIKNAQGQEIAWRPAPVGTTEFQRLNQILELRFQPWVELSASTKLSQANRPKIKPYDPPEIETSIAGLKDDELARALFRACIHGDLEIAKSIWESRGPFEVKYEYQSKPSQTIINDEVVLDSTAAYHCFTNTENSAQLSELMEWMPTVGMGFLVGVDADTAPMLQSSKLEKAIRNLAWPANFDGELPLLAAGVLSNPELMLALQAKSSSSAFPAIFQEVLCWVEEGAVDEFQSQLSGYQSIQSLFLDNKAGTEYLEVPVLQVTDEIVKDICTSHLVDAAPVLSDGVWKYRSLNLQTFPDDPSEPKNRVVLGYQADEPLKHGFNHKPGFVLCRTSVDFLSQFPLGKLSHENAVRANDFAKSYFPLDLALIQTPQEHALHTGCLARKNGMHEGVHDTLYSIKQLFKAFADTSILQPYLQKVINPSLFGFIKQHHCYVALDAEAMIGLHQGLGMDNKGFALEIDHKGLQRLRDVGFRFSDDSEALHSMRKNEAGSPLMHRPVETMTDVKFDPEDYTMSRPSQNQSEGDQEAHDNRYANAIAMNLWPSESAKPTSLLDAVSMAGRKKKWGETPHERSLLAYIDHAGMEACAEVAKTTPHWTFLKDHFGREAMEPFMGSATRAARGKILMDDLGM